MPTITLSMPEELKKEMDKHKTINWSAVARETITQKLEQLKILDMKSINPIEHKHNSLPASVFTIFNHTQTMAQLPNYDFRFAKNHLRSFAHKKLGD